MKERFFFMRSDFSKVFKVVLKTSKVLAKSGMVVKVPSGNRAPLKSSDTNRVREDPPGRPKTKNGKNPKLKTLNYSDSPPSKPLLGGCKSPRKLGQENITPKTPENPLKQTPKKLPFFKLSPSPLRQSRAPGNFSSAFSTPCSSSASPSSSCGSSSASPNSLSEDGYPQPGSPSARLGIGARGQASPDAEARSIVGGSCGKRVASRQGAPLGGAAPGPPVSRRNARERNRVKQVSPHFLCGFQRVVNCLTNRNLIQFWRLFEQIPISCSFYFVRLSFFRNLFVDFFLSFVSGPL